MTNKKSTKRALLMSALSLLLCISMLIGTTYAWFTDTATSAGNKIVAGTLDVDLLLWDGTDYVDISEKEEAIFGTAGLAQNSTNTLWEPGKTQVAYLAIRNNGNLDLKYQVALEVTNTAKNLYEVMEYAVTPNAEKGVGVDKWNGGKAVSVGLQTVAEGGEMQENTTHYFALSIHMKEEAGNEYQAGEVDFDLKVLATQLTSEFDSFDNQYDANATFGTYIELEEGGDLLAALASAEAGLPLTIKLLGDVTYATKASNGVDDITKASSVLIDGDGKYKITATGSGIKPIGDNDAVITFKDMTIADESKSYKETHWTGGYLEIGGIGIVCENVEFTDPILVDGYSSTFNNCSFVGYTDTANSNAKMYAVWVMSGTAMFNNCAVSGTRGIKVCDSDEASTYAVADVNVVVDGCKFVGLTEKPGVVIDYSQNNEIAFDVAIKNSSFIRCQPGDANEYGEERGVAYIYETDNTKATLENNKVDNETALVADKSGLVSAINAAQTGETVMLTADVDYGAAQMVINKDITIDLNGKELTSSNGHIGFAMAAGSIKNGTVNYTGNVGAISVRGPLGSIEDVEINVTPKEGKTITGIQLVNGSGDRGIDVIRDVTIIGATQGIEVKDCSPNGDTTPAIGLMENVKIDATNVGMIVNGYVGTVKNCEIKGANIGINMMLKGEYKVALDLQDCVVTGGTAGIWAHDEKNISNTNNCSLTLTYDAETVINGGLEWDFEDECKAVITLNAPN